MHKLDTVLIVVLSCILIDWFVVTYFGLSPWVEILIGCAIMLVAIMIHRVKR